MPETRRPRRGRPARIDRARIVAVARTMDPETLTMQAVAEELGVDRKALNYHVSDRDGLLELVALDVLRSQPDMPVPQPGDDWRQALRAFAVAMHDGMVGMGALFEYTRMPLAAGLGPLESGEQMLAILTGAGFSGEDAARTVTLITQFVYISARDAILATRHGGTHPQVSGIRDLLDSAPGDRMPHMREFAHLPLSGHRSQLDFDLDIVISGLDLRLESARPPGGQ
ncbi:TetR/AcrR family transcriptional regulator C-terminal domain-containing protein [Actinoplanes couchii]|uniref:TetR family transcriptional regulator n=1 Tax=Actinoplanes couchii TaxID=403638 RepID=A0ABQ3XRC1_9ACTN|nr:TetR/AcrR family transcriptional regulator C-terminal domain-containing protein [Actinoplanes couchii]MDR6320022.1 AcrR family transcriptional regulator [Actinoplanes couchii]GID61061.1 TetR family transcriptional regulator [Actinoplanes couchii]